MSPKWAWPHLTAYSLPVRSSFTYVVATCNQTDVTTSRSGGVYLWNHLLPSSSQPEVSESVSQRGSSITLRMSGAASNHSDLILMCLPSPSLSLTRPSGHLYSLHRKLSREQRNKGARVPAWYVSMTTVIMWSFFITLQAGGGWERLPFGSYKELDNGRRRRSKNNTAGRRTLMHAQMFPREGHMQIL